MQRAAWQCSFVEPMAPSLKPSVYAITAQYCRRTPLAGNRCPLENPIVAQQSGLRPGAVEATRLDSRHLWPVRFLRRNYHDTHSTSARCRCANAMGRGPWRRHGRADRRCLGHPQPRSRRPFQVLVGEGYIGVCRKPWQFSCWNRNDPNYSYVSGARPIPQEQLAQALSVADLVIEGRTADPTDGATHYHALRMTQPPAWTAGATRTLVQGGHAFFRDVP